jgi:formate hydrogenlyase subunit 3/multisubunit Na+/H+ antiporter MnhD subunit
MTWALFVILGVPLVAVLVSAAAGWRAARPATLIAGLVCFGLAIALALAVDHGRSLHTAGGWLRLDSRGAVFLATTGLLYATGAVFSVGYLQADERQADFPRFARRYFGLLNLFGWSMLLVPLASDFGTLWVAVELTTIV